MSHEATDPEDPALAPFRDVRERELRGRSGGFVVEAPRVVMRFLDAVRDGLFHVDGVALDPRLAPDLEDRLHREHHSFVRCSDSILTEISGYRFHAGAIAIGRRPRVRNSLETLLPDRGGSEARTLVVLAGVTSMDNVGGIFRSVAALGGDGVVLDHRCGDPLLRRSIRISMGQVFRIPWLETDDLEKTFEELRSRRFTIVGIENAANAKAIDVDRWTDRTALVIGNEGHGIEPALMAACDEIRRIPGPHRLATSERPGGEDERSLNAGIACAIALHETMRCRRG